MKQQRHVLVVDDDHATRRLYQMVLEESGHLVTLAQNGQEALGCFNNDYFDVILMDYMMPVMSGLEAILEIRKIEQKRLGHYTPIIVITGKSIEKGEELFLHSGANGYLTKPIDTIKLIHTIQELTSGFPAPQLY